MTLRLEYLDEGQRDLWDQSVVKFAQAHPLHAYGWGRVRRIDGWQPCYLVTKENDAITGMIMILVKRIPCTGLSIMYAPKGPLWDPSRRDVLRTLLAGVREEGRRRRAIFVRIDPNLPEGMFDEESDPFVQEGFMHLEHRWTFWNSPRDVYRVDLTKARNEEELFRTIEHSARKSVRKSQKEGVAIRPAENEDELRRFYEIFSNISVEKGFMCRRYEYQLALWREFVERGHGRLFLGIYREEIIGGAICLMFGGKCLGMHMGTISEYAKLQTHSAYIWAVLSWAKQTGCSWFSFRGVGTTSTQENFKKKFHPQEVALAGYYDLPFRPLLYRIFSCLEFQFLPRAWRSLMQLRRGYTRCVNKFKISKSAVAQAN